MVKHVTRVGEEGVCGGQKKISFVLSALPLYLTIPYLIKSERYNHSFCVYLNFIEEKNRKLVHRDKRKPL